MKTPVLICSPSAFYENCNRKSKVNLNMIEAMADLIHKKKYTVYCISNKKPDRSLENHLWFMGVNYEIEIGRQNGNILKRIASDLQIEIHDIYVLAANVDDLRMAKNAGCLLLGASWSEDEYVKKLGIQATSENDMAVVLDKSSAWPGDWWFKSDLTNYSIRALTDLSSINKDYSQIQLSKKLTDMIKHDGHDLHYLLTVMSRSLLLEKTLCNSKGLMWGVYPSSSVLNKGQHVLTEFTDRLRTGVSNVHRATVAEPLFIRHSPSVKRSIASNQNRLDPTNQITTIHLNPFYRDKIKNKTVIVVDDCTTYGTSFAVSRAFLKAAGAKKVFCIAIGKFGNRLEHIEIELYADPFGPIKQEQFDYAPNGKPGSHQENAKDNLKHLFA